MTWFQAQQACQLSGKSMCTNAQWQAAAAGTDETTCNTGPPGCDGADPWDTGDTLCGGCESNWGAFDMVGNTNEYVADWQQAGLSGTTQDGEEIWDAWGPNYGDDYTRNVNGRVIRDTTGYVSGLPAAPRRGGNYSSGEGAGVFAYDLEVSPAREWNITTRCCINR